MEEVVIKKEENNNNNNDDDDLDYDLDMDDDLKSEMGESRSDRMSEQGNAVVFFVPYHSEALKSGSWAARWLKIQLIHAQLLEHNKLN